jgi:trehalose 6-phosphate synthase/phosphatase
MKEEKRLILVSNRLPFQLLKHGDDITLKQSDGGLVSAIISYFENESASDRFSDKVWVGSADFPEVRWKKFKKRQNERGAFEVEPIFIDSKIYNKYYNGFCNATLWPLFHYFPSFVVYDQSTFESYEKVNELFAAHLLEFLRPGDTLWIHDYQLFLLPVMVRDKMPDISIGFFLHIPFPSFEIFRMLHRSWKEKIMRGLLGADLIGFHTHEYVQHFLKSARMVLGYDNQFRTIAFEDRLVKADMFPLGIDVDKFHRSGERAEVMQEKESISKNFGDRKIIFSVDRLDYTKGITHRLAGLEQFLQKHPEWHEKVVFVLVVVPSRQIISKYNERRKLIEEHVGRINGKYSTLSWQPVIYRYNHLSFDELCALYQTADIGLITPLRDGMNLVAKEFVASCTDKGVLILSELAGAANELSEALLINPLDAGEVASAIEQALTMPLNDQQQKLRMMQKRLREYDVITWVNDFLNQLYDIKKQQQTERKKFVTSSIRRELAEQYHHATSRNLLLDYDGTLVPFARHPREAMPDRHLLRLIAALAQDSATNLTIISGRASQVLEDWFKNIPLNLVAEHGAAIKRAGQDHWIQEKEIDQTWKPEIRPTLQMFVQRCPGSFIEEKNHTLAWHYRNADPELGFVRSRELLDNLFHLLRNAHVQVLDGNKVIEVRVAGIDKGVAAKKLIDESQSDFILAIGDDKTDEDMFRVLADRAVTIKVGPGHSVAQYSIAHPQDVVRLLGEFVN